MSGEKYLCGVGVWGLLLLCGCGAPDRALVHFQEPQISLHLYDTPENVRRELRPISGNLKIRPESPDETQIVVDGEGTLRLKDKTIIVRRAGILIGDQVDSSRGGMVRNVILDEAGNVLPDRFIPFEPWWGYHP